MARAQLGRAGACDSKGLIYKAADDCAHVPGSALQRSSTWSKDIVPVAFLGRS